ncbi:hypothetical protein [Thermosinus carboxydivorans]|nr:hypothetical protein [Thermosinus carboxydivorans]
MLKPATKFIKNSPIEQFNHILSEVAEAHFELLLSSKEKNADKNTNIVLARELVDIQVSCETMLACLGYNDEERDKLRRHVYEKNKARGYYDE